MKTENILGGFLSLVGTYVLLFFVAMKIGAVVALWDEMGMLLMGDVAQIPQGDPTLLVMISAVIAIVVIQLPFVFWAGFLQMQLLGAGAPSFISDLFKNMKHDNNFCRLFVAVVFEEVLARGIFLGILPLMEPFSGEAAFYPLFFIGNGIWALMHLRNFKDPKDRHILRVLPQFVGGFFFTLIFIKYGLLASVLAHFAFNAILFAIHKVEGVKMADAFILIYLGVCAATSYLLMEKSPAEALAWLAYEPVFKLPGWGFWDYVKMSIFLPSCLGLVSGFLLYDRGNNEENEKPVSLVWHVLTIPAMVIIMFGLYAFLGLFISNAPTRMILIAISLAFFRKGASGSAVSRTFWCGLPNAYLSICITQALGWWVSMGWLVAHTIFVAPLEILDRKRS